MKKFNQPISGILLTLSILTLLNLSIANAQSAYIPPKLPSIPEKTFSISDYGASKNNETDNTKAIQSAIDAAVNAGGGTVVIPLGVYLCGPIQFGNNLNLHIDSGAVLKMLPIDKYPGGTNEGISFISAANLHDIAITGKGTIDGQGSPWWKLAKTNGIKRPRMIAVRDCERVLLEQVKLMNSPMFHIAIGGGRTNNVTVSGVIVRAPSSKDPINPSHNTDACDVSGTKILIKDCDISVGDDDYTCGGGTSDVLITNCKYGEGHGVSIGSYTNKGVKNITVENCTFTNTESGIRIKTDRDRGGVVENITYRNLHMTNVGFPILIYESYEARGAFRKLDNITPEIAATYPSAAITDKTPFYKNITFQNITATAESGRRAGLIWGLPESAISNVTLENVNITADNPFGIFFADNVQLKNCNINTRSGKNKLAITNSTVTIDGVKVK